MTVVKWYSLSKAELSTDLSYVLSGDMRVLELANSITVALSRTVFGYFAFMYNGNCFTLVILQSYGLGFPIQISLLFSF